MYQMCKERKAERKERMTKRGAIAEKYKKEMEEVNVQEKTRRWRLRSRFEVEGEKT